MSVSYRATSNADVSKFKVVRVLIVDVTNLQCKVWAADKSSAFYVKMNSSIGLFYALPCVDEEWIVQQIGFNWYFHSKTPSQNLAITELSNCNPGDIILSASGDIRVISPLVQENVTNSWTASASIPHLAVTEISALSLVDSDNTSVASIETSTKLKLLRSGTYTVCFESDTSTTSTGRSFLQVEFQSRSRRGFFHDEDRGRIETILPLDKDDILAFKIYHSASGSLTFDTRIDITQVR